MKWLAGQGHTCPVVHCGRRVFGRSVDSPRVRAVWVRVFALVLAAVGEIHRRAAFEAARLLLAHRLQAGWYEHKDGAFAALFLDVTDSGRVQTRGARAAR
jgi:hypothetical protein